MSPPSPLFISSKFSISGSLPTSSNRLSRQAHCSGRLTFQIHAIMCIHLSRTQFLAARAFLGVSTTPPICKPKSAIEERNKGSRVFSNGYSSSLLFICLHCKLGQVWPQLFLVTSCTKIDNFL